MIKISDVETFGFRKAIYSMRNPYESHYKSDSKYHNWCDNCFCEHGSDECYVINQKECCPIEYVIGEADMTLAKKLIKAGPEHRKFLRMIHVQADVVAPRYWWQEASTYKWMTMNSSSTMHLITKRELTQNDFSMTMKAYERMGSLVSCLNELIKEYRQTIVKDEETFMTIKQLLPESYNQLRTIDTNYEALLSIHHQRHNHRLTEWHEFSAWIESLPYMHEFLEAMNG